MYVTIKDTFTLVTISKYSVVEQTKKKNGNFKKKKKKIERNKYRTL